jgi:hypothetical protein
MSYMYPDGLERAVALPVRAEGAAVLLEAESAEAATGMAKVELEAEVIGVSAVLLAGTLGDGCKLTSG